jgi:hypothetical protein
VWTSTNCVGEDGADGYWATPGSTEESDNAPECFAVDDSAAAAAAAAAAVVVEINASEENLPSVRCCADRETQYGLVGDGDTSFDGGSAGDENNYGDLFGGENELRMPPKVPPLFAAVDVVFESGQAVAEDGDAIAKAKANTFTLFSTILGILFILASVVVLVVAVRASEQKRRDTLLRPSLVVDMESHTEEYGPNLRGSKDQDQDQLQDEKAGKKKPAPSPPAYAMDATGENLLAERSAATLTDEWGKARRNTLNTGHTMEV